MVHPLWKLVGQFLVNFSYYPAVLLLGLYPNELKRSVHTDTNVYNSFIQNRPNLAATKMSFSR